MTKFRVVSVNDDKFYLQTPWCIPFTWKTVFGPFDSRERAKTCAAQFNSIEYGAAERLDFYNKHKKTVKILDYY